MYPGAPEWVQAQRVLSDFLARAGGGVLARTLAGLNPDRQAQAGHMLLVLMARPDDPREATDLARTQAKLSPDPAEQVKLRQMLVALLARESDTQFAKELAQTLAELDPGPAEQAQARQVLLARLARQDNPRKTRELAEALAGLDPDPDPNERAKAGQIRWLGWPAR